MLSIDYPGAALALVRAAGAGVIASYLAFLRLAIGYPYAKRLFILDLALVVVGAAAVWAFVFTDAYIVEVKRFELEYIRFEGDYHRLLSVAGLVIVITSYSIHYTKLYDLIRPKTSLSI